MHFNMILVSTVRWGTVGQLLGHYAEVRKLAGARPTKVNPFVSICPNLPTALGPGVYSDSRNDYKTPKNNVSGGVKRRRVRKGDNLTAICEPTV
jgi:hypothetical protein